MVILLLVTLVKSFNLSGPQVASSSRWSHHYEDVERYHGTVLSQIRLVLTLGLTREEGGWDGRWGQVMFCRVTNGPSFLWYIQC